MEDASLPHARESASNATAQNTVQQFVRRRGMPEFSELVIACRYRLGMTVTLGLLACLLFMTLAIYMTDAPYEAKSLVRVRQHQDVVLSPLTSRGDDAAFVRSQEQLVFSPQVLAAALENDRVNAEPMLQKPPGPEALDWLSGLLRVEIHAGSELMSISVLHPSPQLAHVLSHAVTQAYLNEVTERATSDRQRRRRELERAAKEADSRLDSVWEELNTVAKQIGSDSAESLTIRDEIQLQAYRDYAQQLRVAQLRGNELQSLLTEEQLRIAGADSHPDHSFAMLLQNHPDVVLYRERIAHIELQIQQIQEVAASRDSPRVRRLDEDRRNYQQALDELIAELSPRLTELSREQHRAKTTESFEQLNKQIELNHAEREFLQSRMAEIDTSIVRKDHKNGVQLEMSRHAVERQSRLADSLWQALEELKIESQSQPRVTLIEFADFPIHPNHSRQLKAAGAGAGLAWIIVILGIGYFEWSSCKIRNSDDLIQGVSQPVFGLARYTVPSASRIATVAQAAREAAARLMLLQAECRCIPSLMVLRACLQNRY